MDIKSITDQVGGVLGIAGNAKSLVETLLQTFERIRQKNLTQENLLRAYYLEVVSNLEIFDTLKMDALSKLRPNAPQLKNLLERINTDIGVTILFETSPGHGSRLYDFLKKKGDLGGRKKGDEDPLYENVLQAISFTVIKTEVLRQMTTWSDEDLALLKQIQLKTRLENIYQRFLTIKQELDSFGGIEPMAR